MLIYNNPTAPDAPTWSEYINRMICINQKYPLKDSIWFPFIFLVPGEKTYKIGIWFYHLLPAFLVDSVTICIGRRPRYYRNIDEYWLFNYVYLINYLKTEQNLFLQNI